MIPCGWAVIPLGRVRIVFGKMPSWFVCVTWRGNDGWWTQVWPKEGK